MKLCAIISEYNPFHNGHQYHIQKSLEMSGCDAVVCIMNANYSQRGEPTIVDKETRALMAIYGGASAVVALPTYFSVTNAETFAMATVKTACSFKDVTHISFGSECGDIDSIKELATFLYREPMFYKQTIKKLLQEGYSLGNAKVKALSECITKKLVNFTKPNTILELLTKPNNILAVEYVKALYKIGNKNIEPITVKRQVPYSGYELDFDYKLTSASRIRESMLKGKSAWRVKKYMPYNSYYIFSTHLKNVNLPNYNLLGKLAIYKLRTTPPYDLKANFDVVEGFENRLISSARESITYNQLIESAVSKRYSTNRVQRIIMSCLLNLRSDTTKKIFDIPYPPYIKVIACLNNKKLLASLQNAYTIVITRKSDALKAVKNDYAKTLMFAEDRANAMYDLLIETPQEEQLKKASVSDIFNKTIFVSKDDFEHNKTIFE